MWWRLWHSLLLGFTQVFDSFDNVNARFICSISLHTNMQTKWTCSMVKTTITGKQRPELTNPNMNSGLNMVELNFFYYHYYDYYYKLVLLLHGWMHGWSHLRCLNSSELFCSASLTYWLLFPLTFGLWPFYYLGYNGFLDFWIDTFLLCQQLHNNSIFNVSV